MKKINFTNALELSRIYPDSFQIPTIEEILNLKAGDAVKVCANNERFWTKIIEINIDKQEILASVDNKLLRNNLELNEKIKFHFNNIYAIYES